jgi:hypothetical protein
MEKENFMKEYDLLSIKCKQMKFDHDELREVNPFQGLKFIFSLFLKKTI